MLGIVESWVMVGRTHFINPVLRARRVNNPRQVEVKVWQLVRVNKQRLKTKARLAMHLLNAIIQHVDKEAIVRLKVGWRIYNYGLNHLYHTWYMKVDQPLEAILWKHGWENCITPWGCFLQHKLRLLSRFSNQNHHIWSCELLIPIINSRRIN